ncbi:c-type cytochrome [Ruegeria sediminis]|uniref:C-type cytochrome n=1 Tax=Ruegeria sediminis TaxID=2583820 RepID=A0ABY2X3S8_9RHOB|nr:c-type cytochrome [Ruegeria sediminis]TMV09728.1 c-type cytochrome [Ruegeria sediminis]
MRWLGAAFLGWGALIGAARAEEEATRIGDAERGAEIFAKCAGCHEIGQGAVHRVGPHLNGIFDRKVAQFHDFRYSESIERARRDGMVWDLEHLDAYLENPKALVSGTRMNFPGLKEQRDRNDVLAFLRQFSASPQDIPEAAPTARKREVELAPEVLAIIGDHEYGAYLSTECTTCHQIGGDYDGIPVITGWPSEDFVVAMHAYKRQIRPHPVMQMMAGRLSDEEIAALAAYFGALE